MPNKALANEWLVRAWHDLEGARILFNAGHFTDVIGVDLQQSILTKIEIGPDFISLINWKYRRH